MPVERDVRDLLLQAMEERGRELKEYWAKRYQPPQEDIDFTFAVTKKVGETLPTQPNLRQTFRESKKIYLGNPEIPFRYAQFYLPFNPDKLFRFGISDTYANAFVRLFTPQFLGIKLHEELRVAFYNDHNSVTGHDGMSVNEEFWVEPNAIFIDSAEGEPYVPAHIRPEGFTHLKSALVSVYDRVFPAKVAKK